jgi:hypothetical protein
MSWKVGYWSDLIGVSLDENNRVWIHAARPGHYQHPVYGDLDFDDERLKRLSDSVKLKIRGIDPDIDYDHKTDPVMGKKAAGWVKDSDVRPDGLWLLVEFTDAAAKSIKEKEYRYFSPEYHQAWTDAQGKEHKDVLFGGGLTNRPFLKDLLPINLSELSFVSPAPKVPPTLPEGVKEMDLKELAKLIGLGENATEAEVTLKLTEMAAPKETPPPPAPPKQLNLTPDLRKLAEDNPVIDQMIKLFEQSERENAANKVLLREQEVSVKLHELDSARIALAPSTRKLIQDLGLAIPVELTEKFWNVIGVLHKNTHALVELGERGGAHVKRTADATDVTVQLQERIDELVTSKQAKDALEAYSMAFAEDPALYDKYRAATYIK